MSLIGRRNGEPRDAWDGAAGILVERIQAGETECFTDLYELYFEGIYSYLRVMLRDEHEAEDLAQQVFVQAFQKIDSYRADRGVFRAWLFRIARNTAISHLRKQSRLELQEPADLALQAAPPDAPSMPSEGWLTDSNLLTFVERLPLTQRQVLALRFMFDMSYAEVGQVLDLSEQHVRVLQHRALRF